MPKKKVHTQTELTRNPSIIERDIPFDITKNGVVIASVVRPGTIWRECENCGENTQNIFEWKNRNGKWEKLTLCNKCADELL